MQDSAHHPDSDLDAGSRDVDDTAYRHVACLPQDAVWMATRIGDSAPFISTCGLPLSCGEIVHGHRGHANTRRTIAIKGQSLCHGRRGIDDPIAMERAAIIDHRHRLAAIAQIIDPDPGAERQGLVRDPHRLGIERRAARGGPAGIAEAVPRRAAACLVPCGRGEHSVAAMAAHTVAVTGGLRSRRPRRTAGKREQRCRAYPTPGLGAFPHNGWTIMDPMTRRTHPPAEPAAAPARAPQSGHSAAAEPGALCGRMLQASRQATIGEMAAGVAHELNQPLTAIANYAQACDRLLGRPGPSMEDIRTAVHEIAEQAVRAGDILRRVRGLTQSQPIRRGRANLNATVEAIRDVILADARAHRARAQFDFAPDLPPVSIDTAQIQHAILNLVRNALEAPTGPGGAARELTVRTALNPEGHAEIAVLDNGPGVLPEALERMFDPFFSTKTTGTGLGLAISNTVARAHGGSLTYRPNTPAGACFAIRIFTET